MKVALVDYGAGNLASARRSLAAVGADVFVPADPAALSSATAVVIPGVGHFDATCSLTDDWRRAILDGLETGRPLLGICLGLQWLFDRSEESHGCMGLGILPGTCVRLDAPPPLKVPHVGWNRLDIRRTGRLLEGVAAGTYVYFTHAYGAPVTADTTAVATHGVEFAAAAERGPVYGVQFHPEKSGDAGLRVLRNFLEAARAR